DGELAAPVVVACDGVNSLLAKEAGIYAPQADQFTLGVKEVLALPREEIDRRFGLRGREGADHEILGGTGPGPTGARVRGGGFLYTNLDSVAVGLVLSVADLARAKARPEDLLAELKAH